MSTGISKPIGSSISGVAATPTVSAVGSHTQESLSREFAKYLGKSLQVHILKKLTDGSFIAQINGTNLRMALPSDTNVGSTLSMMLAAITPRLRLVLQTPNPPIQNNSHTQDEIPLNSSTKLEQNPQSNLSPTAEFFRPTQKDAITSEKLSSQTKKIAQESSESLLNTTSSMRSPNFSQRTSLAAFTAMSNLSESAFDAISAPILSPIGQIVANLLKSQPAIATLNTQAPIFSKPITQPNPLTHELEKALSQSGLFYESHLSDMALGKLSIEVLRKEPQASMTQQLSKVPPEEQTSLTQLNQIVTQQLDTFENQRLRWQGQIWPEQTLTWIIERNNEKNNDQTTAPNNEQSWNSTLNLELPKLGKLSTNLSLSGNQLNLHISTASEHSRKLLSSQITRLNDNLAGCAIRLNAWTIDEYDKI